MQANPPLPQSTSAAPDEEGCLRPTVLVAVVLALLASLFTRSGTWLAAEGVVVALGTILLAVGASGVSPRGLLLVWGLVTFFVVRLHLGVQHRAEVVIELQTEAARFRLPDGPPGQVPIRLALPAASLEVSSAAKVLIDQEQTVVRGESAPVSEPIDVAISTESPGRAAGVSDISVPAGWDLAVRCLGPRQLQVSVSPPEAAKGSQPRTAAPSAAAEITCAVPAGSTCDGLSPHHGPVRIDGLTRTSADQVWTFQSEPGRALSALLTLPESAAAGPVLVALQGLATRSLDVIDSGGQTSPQGDSNLLSGRVRFTGLELPPADLRFREFLVARSLSGRVLQVCWTPAAKEPRAMEPESLQPHLVVQWEGRATDLRAGHPGSGRNLMPSALVYLLGDREVVFVVTVAVYSLLVLVSLMHRKAPDPGGMIAGR